MTSVANLYSQVLFDLDKNSYLELNEFRKALDKQSLAFFKSSLIPIAEKKRVLDSISFSQTVKGFLYQITLYRRWAYFEQICLNYLRLLNNQQNVLKGIIYTAQSLSSLEKEKIEQALKNVFKNKTILLQIREKQNLIHGIRVEINGICFDDSVLHHLKQFRAQVGLHGQFN